jgi:hypothetical protein
MIEVHVGCGLEDLGGRPDDIARLLGGYGLEVSERDREDGWHRQPAITTRYFLFAEPDVL